MSERIETGTERLAEIQEAWDSCVQALLSNVHAYVDGGGTAEEARELLRKVEEFVETTSEFGSLYLEREEG